MPPAEVGSTANSYEILGKLAEGGMAEIFLARSASAANVSRHVVMKRVSRERSSDTHYVRMFIDEAQLAAQLQHPNIAQVFDVGRLGASYFFTMEYVHGVTVRELLERAVDRNVALPIGCVLAIVAGTAAGLGHAHHRVGMDGKPLGIVHRDVSPSNLMVSFEGHVKVVDFGVAKAVGRPETRAGTIKGKVAYLSPEQCRAFKLDHRSDLFSLGIVLWEMLTLKRLFRRDSEFESMAAIATDDPAPPSAYRAEVTPELDALVAKLLAKEPAERFQTADQLVEAIEQLALRSKSPLSAAALGRLLRELFGERPEPWLVLEHEAMTVITEPVPEELGAEPILDDPELADLEVKLTSQFAKLEPLDEVSQTTNLRGLVHPSAIEEIPIAMRPTVAMPAEGFALGQMVTPLRGSVGRAATAPPAVQTVASRPRGPSHPPVARASSSSLPPPHRARAPSASPVPALAGSGPLPQVASSGPLPQVASSGPHARKPAARPQRLWWWIAGGFGLGFVLTIIVASGGSDAPVATPRDAAVAADTMVVAPAPPPDAAPSIDAALELDAAIDVDAAIASSEPDDLAELLAVEPRSDPQVLRRRLRTKAELFRAYRASRFKDVVAACGQLGADHERAVVCTLAACRAHDMIAQRWERNIAPAQRDGLVTACALAGLVIVDACVADPTGCRL